MCGFNQQGRMFAHFCKPLPCYLLLCAIAALWIDFSRIHLGQTSDSLIPVLVSLQHWTPFYWEQSRFGMLTPLLAMPIQQPLANLLVQDGVTIFAGLAAIGLLTRFFLRSRLWFGVACGSCAVFLVSLAEPLRCDYLIAQPYGVSFSLGLGALLLLEKHRSSHRVCAATMLMVLASWMNLAVGPALMLIVAARWAAQGFRRRRAPLRLLGLLLLGTIVGFVFERMAPYRDSQITRTTPWRHWAAACESLLTNAIEQSGPAYRVTLMLLAVAAALGMALLRGRRHVVSWHAAAGLLLSAFLLLLFAGRSRWAVLNASMPRYIYMAMFALQTGLLAALAAPLSDWFGKRGRLFGTWAAAVSIGVAIGFTYGQPSNAVVRACLDERLGGATDAMLQSGCTHVAGDYWRVWPAVYHANWKLRERGESRTIWGVAFRSLPTLARWTPSAGQQSVVAVLGNDAIAEYFLAEHFPPLGIERWNPLEVRRPSLPLWAGDSATDPRLAVGTKPP
jgi:hypothetical protein